MSSIGAVQENRFCLYATHHESKLHSGNVSGVHGAVPRV